MKPYAVPLPRLGMDLLSEDAQLPAGCVRYAVNVEIDRDGQFAARGGFQRKLAGPGFVAIGAFAGRCWVQQGARVCWLDVDRFTLEPLLDAGGVQPVAACEYNGALWMATPGGLRQVQAGSWQVQRAPVLPDVRPQLRATDQGRLSPGRYGVALSVVDEHGVESGAVWLGSVQTRAGLALTGLPVIPGRRWQVYVTPADGDVLYAAGRFDALLPRLAVDAPQGQLCETMGLQPLPGGQAICAKGARLYVARDDVLLFSRPFRPWLFHPAQDFVPFVGRVRFCAALAGGVFVADARGVWWLAGDDPAQAQLVQASPSLAVADSARVLPAGAALELAQVSSDCVLWLSADGYMLGLGDGSVRALEPGRLALDASGRGRSVFVRRAGRSQVVTLTAGYEPRAVMRPLGLAQDLY